jgi:hypothetical protein
MNSDEITADAVSMVSVGFPEADFGWMQPPF